MKISVIGTGYVGLVSGVMMSHLGHCVTCVDLDLNKITQLQNKQTPIFEPGLAYYIEKYANTNRLQFVHGYDDSISGSDCLFITVGTPSKNNGDADLSGIFQAIESASQWIKPTCVIVLKSTVPPGTCLEVKQFLHSKGLDIEVVSNPEFLREGNAIQDFLEPDRIVIGAESDNALEIMRKVYKPLTDKGINLVETDLRTSELIKYASNTFLANKIAFINEMADLCEIVGADIEALSIGVGLDKRIGQDFLKAGPGFGGSCFPKDILALQKLAYKVGFEFLILDAVIKANSNRPRNMMKKIVNALGGDLQNKKIGILGLTYKAGTDDLRSSPAIELINLLQQEKVELIAYDPEGMVHVDQYFENLNCADSILSAANGADAIIIVTEWSEFKNMNLQNVRNVIKTPIIIDLRNILCAKQAEDLGFKYYAVGHKSDK